jgi:predicted membrane-bound spermidine synthase
MLGFSALRFVALLLTFFTGFTALVYEVTWHFYLANLLGSQARSASLVLATFLGGLAIGYNLFGRFSQRRSPRSLVMLCGALEAAIGIWALIFPWLHDLFWHVQFVTFGSSGSIFADLLVAAGLVGAPTIMMGASLPLLTQGLSRGVDDAAPFHAKVYVVNTLGAFAGTVCAGFVLIPWLGLSATMFFMGIVNCLVGALFVLLSVRLSPLQVQEGERSESLTIQEGVTGGTLRFVLLGAISCIAGLLSITFQTVLIRVVALSIGASVYAFSMVVSAFVLALALGAWIIAERRFGRISLAYNQVLVVLGLVAIYLVVPYLPYWGHVFRTLLTSQSPNFWVYYAVVFAALCCLIVVPVGAMGATLPLSFKEAADRAELLGRRVGLIYGANTAGCVVGAVVGGYLSLYYLNLDAVLRMCLVGGASLIALAAFVAQSHRRRTLYLFAAVCAVFPYLLEPWPQMALGRGTFRIKNATDSTYKGYAAFYKEFMGTQWVEAYKDDPNSTIAVLHSSASAKSILVNGKSDGSTEGGDRVTTKMMAHLPGLLQNSSSRRAAVIGFGTGITVGSLARYQEFDQIDIFEISSAVKEFAPRFDQYNSEATKNPKVKWHLGDAYRFLMETDDTYAVIASEPSNPWVGGVERLYSREFFELAKSKLAPGGIYAQWFHTYSISDKTLGLVLNTFKVSFPHVHVFERGADLVILGSADPLGKDALKRMYERSNREWIGEELTEIGFPALQKLLVQEVLVPWEGIARKAPVHTLDKPKLSYWAGRDFFLDSTSDIRQLATIPRYRGPANRAFADTLLAHLFGDSSESEGLKAVAMIECNVRDENKLFDGWQDKGELCKQALVALVVKGILPPNDQVPTTIVELFKGLSSESQEKVVLLRLPKDVGLGLDWVSNFAGPFIKVDPAKLRTFAEPCFTLKGESALACRSRLVLALAATGSTVEAKEEFERILQDRVPFKNEEYAQSVADVAGTDLTEEQRKSLVLLD